jgi:hypothetical protein
MRSYLILHTGLPGNQLDVSMYKIIRFYFDSKTNRRTLKRGLTIEEAQAHCRDPETSSRTCLSWGNRNRTKRLGAWFDGYEKE